MFLNEVCRESLLIAVRRDATTKGSLFHLTCRLNNINYHLILRVRLLMGGYLKKKFLFQ